jgi:hypothetical protein
MKYYFFAVATLLFCISTAVYSAPSSPGTPTPKNNFLAAVEAGNLDALRALRSIRSNEIDYTHKFYEALDKAAELGSLDALQIIFQHPFMPTLNKSIFPKLAGIARRNGQHHVFRWLYKHGLGFKYHNVAKHIKEALHDSDLESVKFILATKYTNSTMILETLTWAKDESAIHWIKKYAWALQQLKNDEGKEVPAELLHNNFIDFVLSASSPELPIRSIKYLIRNVLYRRYQRHSLDQLDEELKSLVLKKYMLVAQFLTGFIEVRKSQVYVDAEERAGQEMMEALEVKFLRSFIGKCFDEKKGKNFPS